MHITFRVPEHKDLGNLPRPPREGNGTQIIYFPDEKPRFHKELVNTLMLPTCFLFRVKKKQLMWLFKQQLIEETYETEISNWKCLYSDEAEDQNMTRALSIVSPSCANHFLTILRLTMTYSRHFSSLLDLARTCIQGKHEKAAASLHSVGTELPGSTFCYVIVNSGTPSLRAGTPRNTREKHRSRKKLI